MPLPAEATQPAPPPSHAINLRRLVWLRSIAIPGTAVAVLVAGRVYGLPIRVAPLLTIVCVLAVVNFWTFRRLRSAGAIPNVEFFTQETGSGDLQADTEYHFSVSVIGSTFSAAELDGGAFKIDENIAWMKPRRGAVGFAIPRGAEIEISELRIKVLR